MSGRRNEGGFTYVELLFAAAILAISVMALLYAMFISGNLITASRGQTVAMNAARQMVETLRNYSDFTKVYASYNSVTTDDPNGAGTAPGKNALVSGLSPQAGDPDGMPLEILYPENPSGTLREDVVDVSLGMPMDLNGDGATDALDHAGDYRLLPVTVRVAWVEKGRNRNISIRTFLANRGQAVTADAASTPVVGDTCLCHHPPGNPSNAQTIYVSPSAVDAHLAHGDSLGACP
ncbi:MAG: hypothetical protein V1809_07260 [Planctomycetota bacterium]